MNGKINRRGFVKSSLLATAAWPLHLSAQSASTSQPATAIQVETQPMGRIGDHEFSRLILGGNLMGAYAHARDLPYVSMLMRRYNTEAKIRETLELAETHGISCINTWVMQENSALFAHWKNGGKMQWIAQVRLGQMWGNEGGYSQVRKAIDEGAVAIHLTADAAESLLANGKFDKVGEAVQYIRSQKRVAGVAAHDLRVIVECEKLKMGVDFYLKTLHTHDYYTAPRPDEKEAVGAHDNSWCHDPQAVVELMATVSKPWIAFKILAAGAIPPRAAFPYAFNSGADFILVGMFDWQVAENAKLAKRVVAQVGKPGSKRTRPWCGGPVAG